MPVGKSKIHSAKLLKIKVFFVALVYLFLGYFKDTYRFSGKVCLPCFVRRSEYIPTADQSGIDFLLSALLFTVLYAGLFYVFLRLFVHVSARLKKWAFYSFFGVLAVSALLTALHSFTGYKLLLYGAAGVKEFLFSPIFPGLWLPVLWYSNKRS